MLSGDGVLRTTFASSYEKSRFKDNFRSGHPYAEVGLEPDHKKDTAIWCELTFWAVEFLYILENGKINYNQTLPCIFARGVIQ